MQQQHEMQVILCQKILIIVVPFQRHILVRILHQIQKLFIVRLSHTANMTRGGSVTIIKNIIKHYEEKNT